MKILKKLTQALGRSIRPGHAPSKPVIVDLRQAGYQSALNAAAEEIRKKDKERAAEWADRTRTNPRPAHQVSSYSANDGVSSRSQAPSNIIPLSIIAADSHYDAPQRAAEPVYTPSVPLRDARSSDCRPTPYTPSYSSSSSYGDSSNDSSSSDSGSCGGGD